MIAANGAEVRDQATITDKIHSYFKTDIYSFNGLWLLPAVLDPCESQRDCGSPTSTLQSGSATSTHAGLHQYAPHGLTREGQGVVVRRVIDTGLLAWGAR